MQASHKSFGGAVPITDQNDALIDSETSDTVFSSGQSLELTREVQNIFSADLAQSSTL